MTDISIGRVYVKLKQIAEKYGSIFIDTDEGYTTKTCTNCGNQHPTLKGEKIYECPKCGIKIERDYNGARNILLKFIGKLQRILNNQNPISSLV